MNKNFLLILVLFSFQLEASASAILDKYFESLPNYNAQHDVDLNYDFKRGKFSWINNSKPAVRLMKVKLSTTSTNNEFSSGLPNQPTDLLTALFSPSKANSSTPTSETLVSLNDPLSVIISHLNESKKATQKNNQSIPVSQPASFWLVFAGLLGFFALRNKRFRNEKSPPELINLATTNTATVNPINQQEKSTYHAKPTILEHFGINLQNRCLSLPNSYAIHITYRLNHPTP